MTQQFTSTSVALVCIGIVGLIGHTLPAVAQVVVHDPSLTVVNQFALPAGIPSPLGDVMLTEDGTTMLLVGGSERADGSLWSAPVIRDASGTVTGLGSATLLLSYPGLDTSVEVMEGTSTLFFAAWTASFSPPPNAEIVEMLPDGTTAVFQLPDGAADSGFAIVPPWFPNGGDLLKAHYPSGIIDSYSLTDLGNGFFEPVLDGYYSNSQYTASGDMHFVPSGVYEDDLMFTDWDDGEIGVIDIDRTTGLPVGGGATPTLTIIASGFGVGPWGLEFDPITGNLFVSNWRGDPFDGIVQIAGFNPSPEDLLEDLAAELLALADAGSLNGGTLNALTSKLENILAKIDQDNINAATNQLQAFVNQVQALISSGNLTAGQGQPLISAAHGVVEAISASVGSTEADPEALASLQSFAPPNQYGLSNYPNPFNSQTALRFDVPEKSAIRVVVYDVLGRQVSVVADGVLPAGSHEIMFDGGSLPNGIYFARLVSDDVALTRQLVLRKSL